MLGKASLEDVGTLKVDIDVNETIVDILTVGAAYSLLLARGDTANDGERGAGN